MKKIYFRGTEDFFSSALATRGAGYKEYMPPSVIDRPVGRDDYLFMHFYDPVNLYIDHEIKEVTAGTTIIWAPQLRHYYGNPDNSWTHSWVSFYGSIISEAMRTSGIPLGRALYINGDELILKYIENIYDELTASTRPDMVIIEYLFHILVRKISLEINASQFADKIPGRFMNVRRYIEDNAERKISLQELADAGNLSVSRFSALFKTYFGLSPIKYIESIKMTRAAYLLDDHNLSIRQIAGKLGYDDPFYFSRQFKKHFKQSPDFFRKDRSSG